MKFVRQSRHFLVLVLFTLFVAAALRRAAIADFFAATEVADLRFGSFAATVFVFARTVLLALRVALVFEADLLFVTRLLALDKAALFAVRLTFGFELEAGPNFFVFDLVVFLDFLGAVIANLSTRKLPAHATDPARTLLQIRAGILFFKTAS